MPRTARASVGGIAYYVINRGNARRDVFLKDGDFSRWMHWVLNAHVRRYHQHYHSSGHIWQGRFKAFPIQLDEHLLSVLRYVERPRNWLEWVNQPLTMNELADIRQSDTRGAPYGQAAWMQRTAKRLGLESTLRPRGRPHKAPEDGKRQY
jgi:putative transposase